MTNKPENPPAFPMPETQDMHGGYGMTLRDYFAAKSLQAMLGNDVIARSGIKHGEKTNDMIAWMPETAYKFADAMLRARELKF